MPSENDPETPKEQSPPPHNYEPPTEKVGTDPATVRAVVEIPNTAIERLQAYQQQQQADSDRNYRLTQWAVRGAWVYAAIASLQFAALLWANHLTRSLLMGETRPIIAVSGLTPEGCVCANLKNTGKDTAIAQVRKRSGFSPTRLLSGPSLEGTAKQRMIIPAADIGNRLDFDKPGLSRDQTGWFYLSGLIEYGDGYYTRFCREYAIAPPSLTEELCEDPKTNEGQ